ncbi:hypothetical protein ACGFNU_21710 [Spirillospora sp. NPDC048911]|uniref:hypothetical protein n=1 Tax=Spirillospora sp. NPDC048911 TaxID=3364527 RepID=UPI00371415E9
MSFESRTYDNDHGDPVVVLVVTGTHDVSRLMNLLAGSRMALCEHQGLAERMLRQVKRHNGGAAALRLLREHGGPDLLDTAQARAEERVLAVHEEELTRFRAQERGRDLSRAQNQAQEATR